MSPVIRAVMLLGWALPAAAPASLAARPSAPLAGGAGSVEIDYLRVLLAVVLCLALAVLILLWIKRHAGQRLAAALGQRHGQSVRVVERVRLSPRATLHVVEFDGQRILVASDPNGVYRIAQGELQEAPGTPATAPDSEARS
jgi:flagellar biogenesis protein FliO